MAEEPKAWKAEYAKSGRAQCQSCSKSIAKGELRLGRMVPAQGFSGMMPLWHHVDCIFKQPNQIASVEDIDGFDGIRWEDQKAVRAYVDGGDANVDEDDEDDEDEEVEDEADEVEADEVEAEEETSLDGEHVIEIAKSSRSACKLCKEKIMQKTARVATGNAFRHVKCFIEAGFWKRPIEDMPGWEDLGDEEQSNVQEVAKPLLESLVAARKKRQAEAAAADAEKKLKKQKLEDEKKLKKEKLSDEQIEKDAAKDLEKNIKRQTKALWAINDALRDLSTAELKEMLALNHAALSPSENILRERCADGMLFGPLESCPVCGGPLAYVDGQYNCQGEISEWSRCNYTTREPKRNLIWKIPKTTNSYLLSWNKQQKQLKSKETRILRPQSVKSSTDNDTIFLKGLQVFFFGNLQEKSQAEWKTLIEDAGGVVHRTLNPGVTVIVSTEADFSKENPLAESLAAIPVVGERYLKDCVEMKKRLPYRDYRFESSQTAVTKVKVKGRAAVHEDSEMQDRGHVLEVGKTVYSVTLNMSDLARGVNSYYILQVIEEDKKQGYHVFRRYGNVGSRTHGGKKLEAFSSRSMAIEEFKRLFLEKTGNDWEYRETGFTKMSGRYYPVEIDYGVDDGPQMGLAVSDGSKSRLHPRVVSLMQMLFDIETYRAAMSEFEINTAEMPLGKLSKRHIAKGFEILTQVQDVLKSDSMNRNPLLLDASNRFYTLIPTVNPVLIGDEEALKTKIQMLEALKDIEIASQIISTGDVDEGTDPLDLHYKKLNCDVFAVPHDSAEFALVKKYLERTHAPTHTEWALEVEDVFMVRRDGEDASYASMKSSLKNQMLLWHGSRTTNFVGILSQGLRIAPPEAPVTGYMFGKGVYFADLVSKSAQYCFTSRANPVGLMLLSEVALGDMKEYTQAQYMEKPPAGYNSTKGVGKTAPDPSEFETFEDNVVVPCGRPVTLRAHSSLLYNEYIVYSTSQIKLRFLLKVRFKHKR